MRCAYPCCHHPAVVVLHPAGQPTVPVHTCDAHLVRLVSVMREMTFAPVDVELMPVAS